MTAFLAVVIGLVAGVASGLAGVGGGVVMVPAMTELLGMEQAVAQGTSLLAILFTSVSGTVANVRNRRVHLPTALLIGVSGAAAAWLGARAALALDPALLRRLFGLLVLFSGGRMLWQEWWSRRSTDLDPSAA
ncbi:MAG: sulfite exporter TauE/SafE family protein [Acidimicrobiia bacterium]